MMRPNIGTIDRIVRLLLGLIMLAFALKLGFPQSDWNWLGWLGVIPLLTALFRVCPAYSIIGLRTGP
jgi:predicted Na+-dependent transporter